MHSSTAPTTMGKQETAGEMAARHRQTRGQNVAAWTEPYCKGYRCTAQGLSRGCGSGKVSPFWTRAKHHHWPDHDRLVQFPRIVRKKKNLLHTQVQSLAFCECVLRLKVTCSTSHDYLCCTVIQPLSWRKTYSLTWRWSSGRAGSSSRLQYGNCYEIHAGLHPGQGCRGRGYGRNGRKRHRAVLASPQRPGGIRPWPGLASPLAPSMICND
jgi:hypothetical protein